MSEQSSNILDIHNLSVAYATPRGAVDRHRSDESTGDQYGDRVLASGQIFGETRWQNQPLDTDVIIGRASWTWQWVLICRKTAKGNC